MDFLFFFKQIPFENATDYLLKLVSSLYGSTALCTLAAFSVS
jgi:hypothetical protein